MIRVTWAWLGQSPAFDLANTVAVEDGVERDLLAKPGAYERWAAAEAEAIGLSNEERSNLVHAGPKLLMIRPAVRAVLTAAATGSPLPPAAIASLNAASRAAPEWLELDLDVVRLATLHGGRTSDGVVAGYVRSALRIVALHQRGDIRACPAPSCGMFYQPTRARQIWCSVQCGTRTRVARSYHARARRTPRPI